MNLRKTAILALILGAFILYIYQVQIPRDQESALSGKVLGKNTAAELTKIEVQNKNESFTITRTAPAAPGNSSSSAPSSTTATSPWRMTDRAWDQTDSAKVTALVNALDGTDLGKSLPAEDLSDDLSVYGLKDPEVVIIATAKETPIKIELGKLNAFVNKRYAKVSGHDGIFMIPDTIRAATTGRAADFREHSPINFIDGQINKISMSNRYGEQSFEIREGFEWQMKQPVEARASDAEITAMLGKLRAISANDFIETPGADLKIYGLAKPALKLELGFRDATKQPLTISIGRPGPEITKDKPSSDFFFQVGGNPTIFRSSGADPISAIVKPVIDYREKQFLKMPTDLVTKVEFSGTGMPNTLLAKSDGKWQVNGKAGDEPFVQELIKNLSEVSAADFADPKITAAKAGLDKPRFQAVVTIGDGKAKTERTLTLTVGNEVTPSSGKSARKGAKNDKSTLFYAQVVEQPDSESATKPASKTSPLFILDQGTITRVTPKVDTLK